MSGRFVDVLNRTYRGLFGFNTKSFHQAHSQRAVGGRAAHSVENMAFNVQHDVISKCFFIELKGDGGNTNKAVLDYEWIKDGVIDLYHTEVPAVFRGKGVAKLLAKAAMDHVVEKDAQMVLTCTYLVKYAKDNPLPEYTSRIV